MTLHEVAAALGVSHECVRWTEERALEKLRRAIVRDPTVRLPAAPGHLGRLPWEYER